MSLTPVTHLTTFMSNLGGVQSILKLHHAQDRRWDIDSNFFVFFEPPENVRTFRAHGLGLSGSSNIRSVRKRFSSRITPGPGRVFVYHDAWGLPFLSDLDQAWRRIAMVHCPSAFLLETLRRFLGRLDGVLCNHPEIVSQIRQLAPEYPPDRIAFFPVPIQASPISKKRAWRPQPMVLGYSGRLVKPTKRVDRLVQLHDHLMAQNFDFRLELLGSGPDENWLRGKLGGSPRVLFHGELHGADYWEKLENWDVIIYVSDVEGMGIALLEAMSIGIIPLYPKIGGGQSYVRQVSPTLLYAPGNIAEMGQALLGLSRSAESEITRLQQRCREAVAWHGGEAYESAFANFLQTILKSERISPALPPRRGCWTDLAPIGLLTRFHLEAFQR